MNSKMKTNIVIGSIVAILLFLIIVGFTSYSNTEVDFRTAIKASQQNNRVVYDRVWKTIQQQASVSNEYAADFQAIYKDIMKARNEDSQKLLAKFVKEANPNFDSSLFKKLMVTIESNRLDFEREQKHLIDLSREHNRMLQTLPGSMFLSLLGRKEIDITLVTSSKTENAFKNGEDNDVELFDKKK